MPRLRSHSRPAKLIPEAERPLADYFPVSRKQLSEFLTAWTKKEKRLKEIEVNATPSRSEKASRPDR